MKQFLVRRWFLIMLAILLIVGIFGSSKLEGPLSRVGFLRNAVVATVLFLMALPLELRAIGRTLRRPAAPLLAVAINFGLLPLFGWLLSRGLDPVMANGLLVAAATPSTLASASVWTRRAGGNDGVAIIVTLITNLSCFVVTPLWLLALTGHSTQAESLGLAQMIGKLGLLVVLPMAFAQMLRVSKPLATWATARKMPLGVLAQSGILIMVFLGAVQTGQTLLADDPGPGAFDLLMMVGATVLLHVGMLFVGIYTARAARMKPAEQIAVGISGSQKTLMVGLQAGMDLGFSILPMVTYHVGQLLIDTVIADRFRERHFAEAPPPPAGEPQDELSDPLGSSSSAT